MKIDGQLCSNSAALIIRQTFEQCARSGYLDYKLSLGFPFPAIPSRVCEANQYAALQFFSLLQQKNATWSLFSQHISLFFHLIHLYMTHVCRPFAMKSYRYPSGAQNIRFVIHIKRSTIQTFLTFVFFSLHQQYHAQTFEKSSQPPPRHTP